MNRLCLQERTYLAAARPEGPAPMIATLLAEMCLREAIERVRKVDIVVEMVAGGLHSIRNEMT